MNLASHIGEQTKRVNYARHVTHGMSKDPQFRAEYQAWQHMKRRCYSLKCKDYPQYGGVGIEVCERWINDFAAFFFDMGPRPSSDHSVDRRDGTKGYSKENCRWATAEQQSQNRPEFVVALTFGGQTKTIAEWAREKGLSATTIYGRHNAGWSTDRILGQSPSNEIRKDNRFLTFNGETFTVAQWTKKLGLGRNCLKQRLRTGWTVERALSVGAR